MRVFLTLVSATAVLRQALASPAPERDNGLQKRAAPAACAKPVALNLAYTVLSALHAEQFCTSWLGITTKTVGVTQSAFVSVTNTNIVSSNPVVVITPTTTITIPQTSTVVQTVTLPTVTTTVPASTTVFITTTHITTATQLTTQTTTTYLYDVEKKRKDKRDPAVPAKPTKFAQIQNIADNLVSSGCSCLVTTPTVTATAQQSATITVQVSQTIVASVTSIAPVITNTQVSVVFVTNTVSTQPLTTITSVATLTQTTTVATQVTTFTRTDITFAIVDVVITPVELDGCTVGTNFARFNNIGGNSFEQAAQICAAKCVAAGKTNCDDFFTQQNLPGGSWDCFLLRVQDEVNSNFFCNNPNIGRAAEWIIIY